MEPPLGLARGDERVEDDLRAVEEIAELSLPDDQVARALHRLKDQVAFN